MREPKKPNAAPAAAKPARAPRREAAAADHPFRHARFVMSVPDPRGLPADEGAEIAFGVTDQKDTVKVTYTGILPDLFREGQGVVTEGTFRPDGVFVADSVLAKHDERYMPKEVAEGLKAKGVWQPD